MKFSVRTIVILLPIIVAGPCAWYTYSQRLRQSSAMEWYCDGLRLGSDASPTELLKAFGESECARIMTRHQPESTDVVFDGSDRWVQVLRTRLPSSGDKYMLFSLKQGTSFIWTLPEGTVIDKVYFEKDDLVFYLHGNINQGSYRYTIAENMPVEYRLNWRSECPFRRLRWANL